MYKVMGVQRKSGEFNGIHYDNVVLHCLNDTPTTPTIAGDVCEMVKIKAELVGQVFAGAVKNDNDLRDLVGCTIYPYFDRYGKVNRVDLMDKEG